MANCVVLVPAAAVGAVGVPVKDGEAIVALKAIFDVFNVILAVLELTRVSSPTIELVFEVILAAFAFTPFVNANSAAVALVISAVILLVLELTRVSSPAIELVFEVILAAFAFTPFVNANSAAVALVISAVILLVLELTRVSSPAIELVFEVMLAVFAATNVGKVAMVVELTPPTLFTVGKSDVPPKSLVNLSLPLVVEVASGVEEALIPDCTPESTIA